MVCIKKNIYEEDQTIWNMFCFDGACIAYENIILKHPLYGILFYNETK